MTTFTRTYTLEDAELEVTFNATPYVPAYISGPPEACSPAEGGEVELESVMLWDQELLPLLSESACQRLIDKASEELAELFTEEREQAQADAAEARARDREDRDDY